MNNKCVTISREFLFPFAFLSGIRHFVSDIKGVILGEKEGKTNFLEVFKTSFRYLLFSERKRRYDEGKWRYDEGRRRHSEGRRRYDEGKWRYDEGKWRYDEGRRRYSEGRRRLYEGKWRHDEGKWRHDEGKCKSVGINLQNPHPYIHIFKRSIQNVYMYWNESNYFT